jgi:hypothetical protein
MTTRIQGIGWVTPLGRELGAVWEAVQAGISPNPAQLTNPFNGRGFPVWRVDPATVADVTRLPRLRRSSVISHFAVAAALDALRAAGCDPAGERLAVVFAATNGGVIYTRRFFEEISKTGTQAGSPLMFPETVYNAPASHIAAVAGVTGVVTTLVNDATAGVDAISAACDLLDSGACDRCLVVAAEEADWAICEASAALLLGPAGDGPTIERIYGGATFRSIAEARRHMAEFAADAKAQITVSSASGTSFDEAEADLPEPHLTPKASFGEAFATSTLLQVACAALALQGRPAGDRAFVPTVGFHGQVAALTLQA